MTSFPLPELDFETTRPFWEAAARSELVIPRCASCAAWNRPPAHRPIETAGFR